jgi:hypothetical protein
MKRSFLAVALVATAVTITLGQEQPAAQEKPATEKPPQMMTPPSKGLTPLKVQFVLQRVQGEKKISSMPYTLGVLANGRQTSMRMGITVPVTQSVFAPSKGDGTSSAPMSSYTYRDVGTNIDCSAVEAPGGGYSLNITVEDSSIQAEGDKTKVGRDAPIFRRFNASFSMLLRDGQTMQYMSVTDPLSGEVMRIDVTLNLAK